MDRKNSRRKGNAVIEFAIAIVGLLALCMGAADFSRCFYHAIVMTDAAAASATYGAIRTAHSGRFAAMRDLVQSGSVNVSATPVSAEADRFCDCPSAPADGPNHINAVNCATASCAGYGLPRTYVRVRGGQNFQTIRSYPLIPESLRIGQRAYRRVQ